MVHSMWSGMVTFGMVTIPVRLYSATASHNVAFHLLHEKCDTRIKEQRWCPRCDEKVDWDDIVRGYEYSKDNYVELTDQDFDRLPLPSKHTIEIVSFVGVGEIHLSYIDSTYYVEIAQDSGQKPYQLLVETMEAQKVVALGKIAFRTKERICALRSVNGVLHLETLFYRDEIKKNEMKQSRVSVSVQEKKMAESLVKAMKAKFEPKNFKDNYQAALKKLIQSKLKGIDIEATEPDAPTAVTDLMKALQASINKANGKTSSSGVQLRKSAADRAKRKRGAA